MAAGLAVILGDVWSAVSASLSLLAGCAVQVENSRLAHVAALKSVVVAGLPPYRHHPPPAPFAAGEARNSVQADGRRETFSNPKKKKRRKKKRRKNPPLFAHPLVTISKELSIWATHWPTHGSTSKSSAASLAGLFLGKRRHTFRPNGARGKKIYLKGGGKKIKSNKKREKRKPKREKQQEKSEQGNPETATTRLAHDNDDDVSL